MGQSSARADNWSIIRVLWWSIVWKIHNRLQKKRKIILSSCTNPYKFVILGEYCGSEWSFIQNFPGGHIPPGYFIYVLSHIQFTLQVHIGAIITSLYNTQVNRLLINHRSGHTSDDWLWTSSQLPPLIVIYILSDIWRK